MGSDPTSDIAALEMLEKRWGGTEKEFFKKIDVHKAEGKYTNVMALLDNVRKDSAKLTKVYNIKMHDEVVSEKDLKEIQKDVDRYIRRLQILKDTVAAFYEQLSSLQSRTESTYHAQTTNLRSSMENQYHEGVRKLHAELSKKFNEITGANLEVRNRTMDLAKKFQAKMNFLYPETIRELDAANEFRIQILSRKAGKGKMMKHLNIDALHFRAVNIK